MNNAHRPNSLLSLAKRGVVTIRRVFRGSKGRKQSGQPVDADDLSETATVRPDTTIETNNVAYFDDRGRMHEVEVGAEEARLLQEHVVAENRAHAASASTTAMVPISHDIGRSRSHGTNSTAAEAFKQSYLMNAAAYTPRISRTSNRTNRQVQILLRSVEELDGNTLQRNSSGFADKA